ncbi:MAG: UDP-N-acetylmuramate dehydrogenase [Bacteroidaceae bacterium]|nr:UDP-N-acetylmuramate dehydrogenase [Bacteroidaceae bacterium]
MIIERNFSLLHHHTFHIPVMADYFIEYDSVDELKDILSSAPVKGNKFLQIGGGSNLLFIKDYNGTILHSAIRTIGVVAETEEEVVVRAGSGIIWDDLVAYSVEMGWGGLENLSNIPGEVGASAVQNIGAYGIEVKDVIERVECIETDSLAIRTFRNEECMYGYRSSIFKKEMKGRFIVTAVHFRLQKKPVLHLEYGNLSKALMGVDRPSPKDVREAVIKIRSEKLPDPDFVGNAGSFFMNPVVEKELYDKLKTNYPDIPCYLVDDEHVKIPAAWLIDKCGWKGKSENGATVYEKQCLVLINRNNAKAQDIFSLADKITASVKETFGISIYPEVNFID